MTVKRAAWLGLIALVLVPRLAPAQTTLATQTKRFERRFIKALKRLDERRLILLFFDHIMTGGCETEAERISAGKAVGQLVSELQPLSKTELTQISSVAEYREKRYIILIRPHRKTQSLYRVEVVRKSGQWLARSILTCDYDQAMSSPLFNSLFSRLEGVGKPRGRSLPD